MIEILVGKVFCTRNIAHLAHLKTKNYAQHVALGSFYESIIGDIDAIVECYQGIFGLIDVPTIPEIDLPVDIIKHIEKEAKWISDNRKQISKGISAIENLVDNISATYFTALYKLKNLS